MNPQKAIGELIRKKFRAVLTNEEIGEFLLLFSYEIEANLQKLGVNELFNNTFDKYLRQRKLSVSYN